MDDSPLTNDVESDGSDGEDLMTPSNFLVNAVNYKSMPEVKTPQKGIRPENCTSPAIEGESPREPHKAALSKKYSLVKLLTEKEKQKATNYTLPELQSELDDGIKQGGIIGLLDNEKVAVNSQLNLSQDLSESCPVDIAPEFKPKIDKLFDSVKNDFPDTYPGEYIICYDAVKQIDSPPLQLLSELEIEDLPTSEYGAFIEEWIASKALADFLFLSNSREPVLDWLLECMCHHTSIHISKNANEILTAVVTQESQAKELPHWLPSVTAFVKLLNDLGASIPINFSDEENLHQVFCTEREGIQKCTDVSFLTLNKIQHLITFYSVCLQCYPEAYTKEDLRAYILTSELLILDPRLQFVSWDLQVLVGHAFQAYKASDWEKEAMFLCRKYAEMTGHHGNYVHLADCIAPTERGLRFQHTLALYLVSRILQNGFTVSEEELQSTLQTDKMLLILKICCSLSISETTDYYLLNSIISLINLALPVTGYAVSEKKALQAIMMKFRSLNGSIRDPRGAFMNRTKVKDLIVRIITKLNYFFQGVESQCHLEDYFEKSVN